MNDILANTTPHYKSLSILQERAMTTREFHLRLRDASPRGGLQHAVDITRARLAELLSLGYVIKSLDDTGTYAGRAQLDDLLYRWRAADYVTIWEITEAGILYLDALTGILRAME